MFEIVEKNITEKMFEIVDITVNNSKIGLFLAE